MKKIVSLLLVAMMLLSGAALAEDKVNLTAFQYSLESQNPVDFNEMWFFQQIEEKTGVHVDFRMVKDADWSTQLNLMFAVPDEMEDMILRNGIDVEEYGVTQGLLLPLDEYLTEEIMPNYMSRINLNNAGDSIPASDGKSYYIGYLIAQNVNHNSTWYINPELLQQVGKDVPKTIEEDGRTLTLDAPNRGLAKGGRGDVLAGIIGGLLAQGLSAFEAAGCGVWLHSTAARKAAQTRSEAAMLPTDVLEAL